MNWYHIKNIDSIDSPALVIYKNRVQQNIAAMLQVKDAAHLRPHIKTNKIAEVCQMMLDAGITKFKCATIAEAEMLGKVNAPDILLAYQPTPVKAVRFTQLIKKYPGVNYSCLVDNEINAISISNIFLDNNVSVDVYIDLNIGMNRTGIKPENALELFENCSKLKGINIIGLHAYDGHIRDSNFSERKLHADTAFIQVMKLAGKFESAFGKKMKIVAGGTPTFPVHAQRENIDCSPGTCVFWDYGYNSILPDEHFEYAALVITRVISIIDEQTICVDLGHKSVASENTIEKRIHFLNPGVIQPTGQSEEHLVLKVENSSDYKIGDVFYGAPYHICPTVALYERAIVIDNNEAVSEWKIVARDRKITI